MIARQKILDAIEECNASLQQLAANGHRGFECSPQSLEILAGWERPVGILAETLTDIRSDLGDCQRCKLASARTHIVFGNGHAAAKLVFVG